MVSHFPGPNVGQPLAQLGSQGAHVLVAVKAQPNTHAFPGSGTGPSHLPGPETEQPPAHFGSHLVQAPVDDTA
jgi:hypothetical protein